MNRAVIAIGVCRTGGLPPLQAAVQSARAFADWARTHQKVRHVRLITDERSAVSRDRVFQAVADYAALGFVEQLIVYFSGHGINIGGEERWLLSKAPADGSAAVNVRASEFSARFCGIGHVVFVSDACRTAADSIQAQGVTGSSMFPNSPPSGPERPVDQFYATLVGQPALEIKSVADAVAGYRAAYSDVLLAALRGEVHELIDEDPAGHVIRAWPLKRYLQAAVPPYVRQLGVTSRTQQPDARIESDPAAWLAVCAAPPAPGGGASSAKRRGIGRRRRPVVGDLDLPVTAMEGEAVAPGGLVDEARDALEVAFHTPTAAPRRLRARPTSRASDLTASPLPPAIARAAVPFGPDRFEAECGVKVRGARIAAAAAAAGATATVRRPSTEIQVTPDPRRKAITVALRLDDGSAVAIPVFPGLIAALSFGDDGLLEDIAYEPSANTPPAAVYAPVAGEARRIRAAIAGAHALGVLRLERPDEADRLVDHIVGLPFLDPALAVMAAYALHERRRRDAIRLLDRTATSRLGVSVFDLALLAFARPGAGDRQPVPPGLPMVAQGWSLLEPLGVTLPPVLQRLRGHLRPSMWTHVAADGAAALMNAVGNDTGV